VKPTAKDIAIALSLANICFLRVWLELFAVSSTEAYFLSTANGDVVAAMVNVPLLAAAFLAATLVARRYGRAGRIAIIAGFVGVLVMQLNGLGPELAPGVLAVVDRWRNGFRLEALASVVVFLGLVAAAVRWPRRSLAVAVRGVQIFTPLLAVTYGRAIWVLLSVDPTRALAPIAPPIGAPVADSAESGDSGGPRVVVIVMDALGRRHSVDARPASVVLPEYDRLRAGSVDASQAMQIGSRTIISVPAMLSGLAVTAARASSKDELQLMVDGAERPWSAAPNLLRDAKSLGGVAVVAGWYHPYCRMFAYLDGCSTYPTRTIGSRARYRGFVRSMVDQQLALVPYINLRIRQIDIYRSQRRDLLQAVTTGGRGLVFLHLIIPHTPWIWDPTTESFTLTRFHPDGYYDNMQLMDRVLGELRREMEAAGKWEGTAVLLLSDHVMRYRPRYLNEPPDARVPFVLKLPGQTAGVAYDRPFNAMVTHDLVAALLRGELRSAAEATAWLDGR
jgi:uncharacterized protein YqgC (DUF456 family)